MSLSVSLKEEEEVCEEEVRLLKSWLFTRVGDETDSVVDEMQEEHFPQMEAEELEEEVEVQGTEEYKRNVSEVSEKVRKLRETGCKDGRCKSGEDSSSKPIHDGERKCYYKGELDAGGLPHGQGAIVYEDRAVFRGEFDHGAWNRSGILSTEREKIEGTWKDGLMEGEMKVEDKGLGSWIEGYWSAGVPHGFQREFGPKDVGASPGAGVGITDGRLVRFIGRYFRGVRRGFCWKGLFGGGFICGNVDKEGNFSGEDLAYIYPDFKTVLHGKFHLEQVLEGRICRLLGCDFVRGMPRPRFSKPASPDPTAYMFESPSKTSVGLNPTLPEPWEAARVEVAPSKLPQGGEGLFAKTAIKNRELVSLFNGVRLRTSTWSSKNAPPSDYRIRLNADIDLDIPNDRITTDRYCATLAHKANHSNLPNCDWCLVEHPRFGLIRGLRARQDLQPGEEVLVNYHINLADAPRWYRQVWLQHQRGHKGMSDQAVARLLAKYADLTAKRVEVDLEEEMVVPPPVGVEGLEELPDDDEDEEEMSGEAVQKMREKMAELMNSGS